MEDQLSRMIEELHSRYAKPSSLGQRLWHLRKKYLWIIFVDGAQLLKRCFDIAYIESQSFSLDIKLLLKTIPAVFFGRGAY